MMKIQNADKFSSAGTTAEQSVNADVQHVSQPIAELFVSGSVVNLEWEVLQGHFGNGWLSVINGFNTNYAIWIDHMTGKTKVSGTDSQHTTHNSVNEAKEWCQKDFENKVRSLLTNR